MNNRLASAADGNRDVAPDPRHPAFIAGFLQDLSERHLIDGIGAQRARDAQSTSGQRIDIVLTELGMVTSAQVLDTFASMFALPIIEPSDFPTEPVLPDQIPEEFLRRAQILPLEVNDGHLDVAIPNPFAAMAARSLGYLVGRSVFYKLAHASDISAALGRLYGHEEAAQSAERNTGDVSVSEDDLQRLRDIASEAPTIRLVNRIINAAILAGASDIHIEPQADALRFRYRIDGHLREVERLSLDMQAAVASRVKILARLNIAERRLPQDGRAKFVVGGREVDLRVSASPILHGESIVIRILDRHQVKLDLETLGFDQRQANGLDELLRRPNGIVLVTGPTGSGKTTTLYTALSILNTPDRTIFSVEDPVEYQIAGINQMHVRPNIGLDFAQCLRSILRQDPDIIMVGEMRDSETVRIGIQASLTGHVVLSTLHTNSAAASITRLLDMGAQDFLLASTLNGVLAQRLVRRLCGCARAVPNNQDLFRELTAKFSSPPEAAGPGLIKIPVGCPACGNTGFKGRTSILEMLVLDPDLRSLVRKGVTDQVIEMAAREKGMETLYECGLRKVLSGETSLDEVMRSTRS